MRYSVRVTETAPRPLFVSASLAGRDWHVIRALRKSWPTAYHCECSINSCRKNFGYCHFARDSFDCWRCSSAAPRLPTLLLSSPIPTPSDEKLDDSIPDRTQRSIKFGSMPSWRDEKRKRKSNKHVYGALNRITEADERDSASVKSRESGSQNAGSQLLFEPHQMIT
ncbi:hypothetical protein COOONC_02754 [Cooperia oncophora]